MAISGTGGAPRFTKRMPRNAATPANTNRSSVTIPMPTQIFTFSQSVSPHASVSKMKIRPSSAMNPATPKAATPFPIRVTLVVTSAFASSISSRTSSEAFCDTSLTISPSDFSAVSGGFIPFSAISTTSKALQYLCEEERAGERPEHRVLGVAGVLACGGTVGLARRGTRAARRLERRLRAGRRRLEPAHRRHLLLGGAHRRLLLHRLLDRGGIDHLRSRVEVKGRALVGRLVDRRRLLRLVLAPLARHQDSGGSSSKTLTQMKVAIRFATIVVSAPTPASRPLHISLLVRSLFMAGRPV